MSHTFVVGEHSVHRTFMVIADPHLPVPPRYYGGTERIVHNVCRELQWQGHRVHLAARVGSRAYGGNLITHRPPSLRRLSRIYRKLLFQSHLVRYIPRIDALYSFGRLDYLWTALKVGVPVVLHFQNPIDVREVKWVRSIRKDKIYWVCISKNQIKHLPNRDEFHIIPNTVDADAYTYSPVPEQRRPYLAFLGRLTANKGVDLAIDVARRTGLELKIGGTISDEPGGRAFFEEKVRPNLDEQIQWVGPVDDAQKQTLLGGALALLFPIRWEEPFGIVMVESMACGTPVIALRRGSVPEVIEDSVTGFVCETNAELVSAIKRIESINRGACRQHVERYFSGAALRKHQLRVVSRLFAGGMFASAQSGN